MIRTEKSLGCKRGCHFFGKDVTENILSLEVYMSLYYFRRTLTSGAVISVSFCPMPVRVSASLVLARLALK